MKKILGLDVGTTSIGWAIVEATNDKKANEKTGEIAVTDINNDRIGIYKDAVGVRIISQDTERFDRGLTLNDPKGSTLTPTATRRKYRGSRRMKNRYKLRRDKLLYVLEAIGIKPDGSFKLEIYNEEKRRWKDEAKNSKWYSKEKEFFINSKGQKQRKKRREGDIGEQLYKLRNDAINNPIDLQDLGRILLHFNQLRGYSSDRFSKEEKPKFDYYIAEVLEADLDNKVAITEGDNKDEIKYYKVAVKLKFEEPFNIADEENKQFITEISGFTFKKDINFKPGDFVTIKKPEFKQDKKGRNIVAEYYKITFTTPDPIDWNYRYQELQKNLSEWCETGGTVGSYFYKFFYDDATPKEHRLNRIRNNVVNREWYERELDKIWNIQYNNNKVFFDNLSIEKIVKAAFKDYQPILNEVLKKDGLKEQLKYLIKDKIIYYQRPWQQAKNKGQCPFEKILIKKEAVIKGTGNKELVEEYVGRTVTPRSHPLFQEFKIWQQVNNVRLFLNTTDAKVDLFNNEEEFTKQTGKQIEEVKELLYNALKNSKTLSWRVFVKEQLGVQNVFDELEDQTNKRKPKKGVDTETGETSDAYFSVNFRKRKKDGTYEDIKLKGNTTKSELQKILYDKDDHWFNQIHSDKQSISNLQLLWEIIYDITNADETKVSEIIEKHFGFDKNICTQLANIKFDDAGMGNLSAKAIRQILPLMSNGQLITEKASKRIRSIIALNTIEKEKQTDERLEGLKNFIPDKKARLRLSKLQTEQDFKYLNYWEATAVVYGSHSVKNTQIQQEIKRVKSNSMNNPVVERIVNETISVVNEIYRTYDFDEVRIELSRELKASMDERQQMWEGMIDGATKNEWAKQMLREAKQALLEDNRNVENLDTEASNKNNIDKIKIIEDVVKYKKPEEYKNKSKKYKLNEPTKAELKKYLLWLEQNFKCPYTDQPIPFTDVFARGKVVEIEHILPRERYYLNSYANKVITWREVNQVKQNNGNRTAYEFIVSKRVENTVKVGNKEIPIVAASEWESHVKSMFPKGGKRANLLRKEIPEDPIERTLKETQYINKKLKEKLSELVGNEKVWVTSGAVTDILRDRWHLNNVMKELMRNRFENFEIPTGKKSFKIKTLEEQEDMLKQIHEGLTGEFKIFKIPTGKKYIEIKEVDELKKISDELENTIKENQSIGGKKVKAFEYSTSEETSETKNLTHVTKHYNSKTEKWEDVEVFEGYSKRLDHRHHALDAIIIACTKQNHIQYINTLNAINTADIEDDESKKVKYNSIKNDVCIGNSSKGFKTPWDENKFIPEIKKSLEEIIISHKNTRLLISPSKHRTAKEIQSGKIASIRGELHKETNYAKRNYFEGGKTDVVKLIPLLFKKRHENQLQTMVHQKSFEEIIKETVLKEKYQDILIPLFKKYDDILFNDKLVKESGKQVLREIQNDNLLLDIMTGEPIKWLSTYSEKDKSSRPLGLSMNLNNEKEVRNIADPRIKRLAEYRLNYVNEQIASIDKLDRDKKEKDSLKARAKELKLYSNAIYEVRVKKNENSFEWIELKYFNSSDFDKISYAKPETTRQVKEKLTKHGLSELKKTYFKNPIFLSEKPIEVKKVRQKSYFQNLFEVTPKRYVQIEETFMTYFFKEKQGGDSSKIKVIKFLKFIDAINIINALKPDSIDYKKLIEKEKSNEELQNGVEYDLIFTLVKNDLVYLPKAELTEEQIKEINWGDKKELVPYLYIVKDMNPSLNTIVFQQFYKADTIEISEADAKSIFKNPDLKKQVEEIKYGTVPMLQHCIKVFTDKLGKKIIPYWEFPNGCWDEDAAKRVGLIN